MSSGKLVLHPQLPQTLERRPLVDKLRDLGFLGAAFGTTAIQGYFAGERFLQLITFMGCSPHVRFEPRDDQDTGFCHLSILGPWERPRLLIGPASRAPRCPACRTRLEPWPLWRPLLEAQPETAFPCPACGLASPPIRWNWRHQAGAAHLFLLVHNIFPGEAVPVPSLLHELAGLATGEWGYFFLPE